MIGLHKVFVYGTLLKGERNAHFLKNATCIAERCWTLGKLYDTGYGYPAIKCSDEDRVYGELYEVSDSELIELDRLEDYKKGDKDNLYNRVVQPVKTGEGITSAYVYIAARKDLLNRRITSGDWRLNQ